MSSPPPPRKLDPLAAVLSYLLPGLGQVVQGRIGKGVLFFLGINGLFFYGMWMGQMKNVWLPDAGDLPDADVPIAGKLYGVPKALYYRPQFVGQFWIGAAAWPALMQYAATRPDPDADPAGPPPTKYLGHYMQAPNEAALNDLQRNGNKLWDLGWVYTVIAGVLNVLVIYDAFAGPVIRDEDEPDAPAQPATGAGS
jgi:hypothetical protein